MNIEDLSKSQLLLLTVLVNFVVSIATGVLTVSMLDQAPATVTQTVNQIVDHTIETISTAPITSPIQITTPSKPAPAAPTQEQLTTAAISADVARTVTIYKHATDTPALATGVYLPKSRAVATMSGAALPKEVVILFANGTTEEASLSKAGATVSIYGFSDSATLPVAPAASLIAPGDLKQGQTVIALTKENAALTGIISKVGESGITTNLSSIPVGAALVDLSGDVIGLSSITDGVFLPADRIETLLSAPTASP